MNRIERTVYDILKSNPGMKTLVRNIYQSVNDILPEKGNCFISGPEVKEGYFFGFHDLCPFSDDDSLLLANKLEIPLRMPEKDDPLTVGFWDLQRQKYNVIGQSFAWNYHKGCRLQWLGNDNSRIIYNSSENGMLCSVIYDIKTKRSRTVHFPVDTVSPDGIYATGFSYERLNRLMPGYGYIFNDDGYINEAFSSHTGLFIINLEHDTREMILSIEQLVNAEPDSTMAGSRHFITHSQFSPDGKKIAFLHRWVPEDVSRRRTRLVTCNTDGSGLNFSDTSGMVSHYVWTENNELLAYCQVNGRDGYYLFKDYNMCDPVRVADKLNSDGHPAYIKGSDSFVTDTYPDRRRYSKLYVFNVHTDEILRIAEVKSYKEFQSKDIYHHWACDLHPRVSKSGKYVCFDSVHTGTRALCYMNISNLKEKEQ